MKLMKAFASQLEGDVTFFSSGGGIVRIEGPIKIKQVPNPVRDESPMRTPPRSPGALASRGYRDEGGDGDH
jgi:hypothetical protein